MGGAATCSPSALCPHPVACEPRGPQPTPCPVTTGSLRHAWPMLPPPLRGGGKPGRAGARRGVIWGGGGGGPLLPNPQPSKPGQDHRPAQAPNSPAPPLPGRPRGSHTSASAAGASGPWGSTLGAVWGLGLDGGRAGARRGPLPPRGRSGAPSSGVGVGRRGVRSKDARASSKHPFIGVDTEHARVHDKMTLREESGGADFALRAHAQSEVWALSQWGSPSPPPRPAGWRGEEAAQMSRGRRGPQPGLQAPAELPACCPVLRVGKRGGRGRAGDGDSCLEEASTDITLPGLTAPLTNAPYRTGYSINKNSRKINTSAPMRLEGVWAAGGGRGGHGREAGEQRGGAAP